MTPTEIAQRQRDEAVELLKLQDKLMGELARLLKQNHNAWKLSFPPSAHPQNCETCAVLAALKEMKP